MKDLAAVLTYIFNWMFLHPQVGQHLLAGGGGVDRSYRQNTVPVEIRVPSQGQHHPDQRSMHIQYTYDPHMNQRPFQQQQDHPEYMSYNNRTGPHKRTSKNAARDNSSAIELTQVGGGTGVGRRNSASSSYHQNTGDSGMSAGIGSTEHNSSNSNASSGGNTLPKNASAVPVPDQRSNNYENVAPNALRQVQEMVGNYDHSTTPSRVSQQSGYMSTVSSCWQYEPNQQQTQFKPNPAPRTVQNHHHHHHQHTNHERSSDFPGKSQNENLIMFYGP